MLNKFRGERLIKEDFLCKKRLDLHRSILDGKSIPHFFLERVEKNGGEIAFCYKHCGIYKKVTWEKYWKEVENFCLGLLELGLKRGDRVGIMGDPCPEWFYADMAVLCAGAISFGVYTTISPQEACYTAERAEAKFFIAEDQEYVDKILPFADRFPFLLKIIVIDTRATFMIENPRLISFADVQVLGKERRLKDPDQFNHLVKQTRGGDEPAFLVFTSGTTGPPKPAVLTHQSVLLSCVYAIGEVFPKFQTHEFRTVSYLSLAHVLERGNSLYIPLLYDIKPYIGESIEHLQETLYEVQPIHFLGVPRIWEKMAAQILVGIESSSRIKKLSYRLAMKIGWKYIKMKWNHRKIPLMRRLLHWIAVQMCFRHILHQAGLKKVMTAVTTGAPCPPQIQKLWQVWGIDLINFYGSTEVSGLISSQAPGFPEPGDLGKPVSVNKIKLADDGELLISGPGLFSGYWNDEEKTREVLKDGWLYTDEIFEFTEDGSLKMIDRKGDIMVTSGGKNITPTLIESAIKASPYISETIVFAHGRKFPSALIEIDFGTVSEWARRHKVVYTGFTTLATCPEVYKLIGEEVMNGNRSLAKVEQVKKFRIIPQELDPEAGETTPTRKIKRVLMYKMFGHLVEEMYKTKEEEMLEAQMRF